MSADEIILSILSVVKSGSGTVYLSPLASPFGSRANWPFMGWCYIFDFDDVISIESRELNGACKIAWKKHNVKQFCDFCGYKSERVNWQTESILNKFTEPDTRDEETGMENVMMLMQFTQNGGP